MDDSINKMIEFEILLKAYEKDFSEYESKGAGYDSVYTWGEIEKKLQSSKEKLYEFVNKLAKSA